MRARFNGAVIGVCTRRAFSVWLLAVLLVSALPASLEAQWSFVTNNGSIVITGYSGPGGAVTIPSETNGLLVTGIGDNVFKQNFNLTGVTIPNTVKNIGNSAFDSCIFLKQIIIPDSVTNIGNKAFEVCIFTTNVVIGNGVVSIGDSAFWSLDALTDLVWGTNITTIGGHAFESCNLLTSVRVPDSVTSMGGAVFQLCDQLTNAVIGNGATSVPGNAFASDSALKSVIIGTNVTAIGSQAFIECGLTSVVIPDSVTLIDISAFANNPNLKKVIVGSGVASIGITAFASCSSMTGIYFTGNAPTVATRAFENDTATVYYLPWKSGWTPTLGGLTTAPWNPPVEPALAAFQTNGFGFALVGFTNQTVVVEASTNLSAWTPVGTNTLIAGPNAFRDNQSTNLPKRFYRLHTQ